MIEVAPEHELHGYEPSEGECEILDVDKQAFLKPMMRSAPQLLGRYLLLNMPSTSIKRGLHLATLKALGIACHRLPTPRLQLQPFDDKVARHKAIKYGRSGQCGGFRGHRDSKFKYLMVINDDNNKRVLVTVFERKE